MEPVSTAAAAIGAIKNGSELVQAVAKKIKGAKNAELREQLDEVLDAMTDIRQKVDALSQENSNLNQEVASLKQRLKHRDEFQPDNETGCYWRMLDDQTRDGPFCPKCMYVPAPGRPVRMRPNAVTENSTCPVCGTWDKPPKSVGSFISVPLSRR